MLRVGLTGGIASGKTTVCRILKDAGALIVDADQIARQVVLPGLPAWQAIRDCFGDSVLAPDGSINRPQLGQKVFNDNRLRKQLEACVHPHVRADMDAKVAALERSSSRAMVILDVPLLIETHMEEGLDEVIVVYVPESIQLQRLMRRDGLDRNDAQLRINAQMSMDEKRQYATVIIDNSGDLAHTEEQTRAVYQDLIQAADQKG